MKKVSLIIIVSIVTAHSFAAVFFDYAEAWSPGEEYYKTGSWGVNGNVTVFGEADQVGFGMVEVNWWGVTGGLAAVSGNESSYDHYTSNIFTNGGVVDYHIYVLGGDYAYGSIQITWDPAP